MKTFFRYFKIFVLLIAGYFLFGVLSCMLPDEAIKNNIAKSAVALAEEGLYPKAIIGLKQCQMDNFTDALIMNQIYRIDRKRPVHDAMKMVRANEDHREWDQPGLLLRMTQGEDLEEVPYARYWHGNTFLFRLCFMVMDFNLLRWWLFAISTLLLVVLCCTYYREAGLLKTLALASGFVATCGFVTQFSMQFFPVLAITVVTSLLVIKRGESKNNGLLFFVVGSLACYFDLLTTPLLTLGIPLAVMLSLKRDEGFLFKDNLLEVVRLAVLWGLGFTLTFAMKWALATLILGENVFANAFNVGLYRVGAEDFTRWDAVSTNFNMLLLPMVLLLALSFLIFMLVRRLKFNWKKALLYLLIGLMPYLWIFVFSNHSYVHWWFTYRLQAISVACLMMVFVDSSMARKPLNFKG